MISLHVSFTDNILVKEEITPAVPWASLIGKSFFIATTGN